MNECSILEFGLSGGIMDMDYPQSVVYDLPDELVYRCELFIYFHTAAAGFNVVTQYNDDCENCVNVALREILINSGLDLG